MFDEPTVARVTTVLSVTAVDVHRSMLALLCIAKEKKLSPIGTTDYTNLSRFVVQILAPEYSMRYSDANTSIEHLWQPKRICFWIAEHVLLPTIPDFLFFGASFVARFLLPNRFTRAQTHPNSKFQITYAERHSPICDRLVVHVFVSVRVCVCVFGCDATSYYIQLL